MCSVGVQNILREHMGSCWQSIVFRWLTLEIIDMASNMCAAIGKDIEHTKHWFYDFVSRFPDLKMAKPKNTEKSRDDAVNQEMLHDYFEELGKTLEKYEIIK